LRPALFAGAGLTINSRDLDSRMRLASDASRRGWVVEAGFPVKARVGIGVEFGGPSDATGETRGMSFDSRGRQRERLLMGVVRVRAAGTARWNVDVIGGAGALFQHHEASDASCPTCDEFKQTMNHVAPAFVAGGDAFVRVRGPVWAGVLVRYHVLTRGSHQSQVPVLVPWQFEWKSSNRFSVGIAVRLVR
jgi:hypothetical protein